jgi:putative hydrolase of the HAD superfamily
MTGERVRKAAIKAVIFDMDNTLFDFVEAKIKACRAVIDKIGRGDERELLSYFLRWRYGFEDHENIEDYLVDLGVFSEGIYEECCRIYDEVKFSSIEPYQGISKVLEMLRDMGLKLAVVTDALNGNAVKRLKKAGLIGFFDVLVSADMTGKRKPEPDSFVLALDRLEVEPEEALLIGDSINRDIVPGKRIGMLTVYAAYGDRNFFEEKVGEADFTVKEPLEIVEVVERLRE